MSRLLVTLRGQRTQGDAGALAGLTQVQVSRAERNVSGGRLEPDKAEAYAHALGASPTQLARLVELATAKGAETITTRAALVRVASTIQERIGGLEDSAELVRSWVPHMIPGQLQTRDYTAALLDGDGGGDPGPDWWAARSARTARLHEPAPVWHVLLSEAGLRWVLGSGPLMAAQVQHIVELSALPTVRVGVIDLTTPKQFAPVAPFDLYDATTVAVATEVGTSFITDTRDIHHFENRFNQLSAAAAHGDDARAHLRRIAMDYRHTDHAVT